MDVPIQPPVDTLDPRHVVDLLLPPAIRRARADFAVKLVALHVWWRAGCCHRPIAYHPAQVWEIGYAQHRTGRNLLAAAADLGWVRIADVYGHIVEVEVMPRVWELVASSDAQPLLPIVLAAPIPPPLFGGDPRLVAAVLPLRLLVDERVAPAEKITAIYLLARGGYRNGSVAPDYRRDGRELGRRRETQWRTVQRLIERGAWREAANGMIVAEPAGLWLPQQLAELRLIVDAHPSAAIALLPLALETPIDPVAPGARAAQQPTLDPVARGARQAQQPHGDPVAPGAHQAQHEGKKPDDSHPPRGIKNQEQSNLSLPRTRDQNPNKRQEPLPIGDVLRGIAANGDGTVPGPVLDALGRVQRFTPQHAREKWTAELCAVAAEDANWWPAIDVAADVVSGEIDPEAVRAIITATRNRKCRPSNLQKAAKWEPLENPGGYVQLLITKLYRRSDREWPRPHRQHGGGQ